MQGHEPSPSPAGESLRDAQRRVAHRLAMAGVDDPVREARRVVLAATGLSGAALLASPDRPLTSEESRRLEAIVARRACREPLSRIVGEREFYGRAFHLSPATLDPRADSETLIDAVLELVEEEDWRERPLRILDVGTGTGCLLVTLLAELPKASGVGTDISPEALAVAEQNALRHGVADRARFRLCDVLGGIEPAFDLLISNPPYISSGEIPGLAPEVRTYDPVEALDGGPDGLYVFGAITKDMARVVPNGWIVVEIGTGQADSVAKMLAKVNGGHSDRDMRLWHDLGGHIRCVAARTLR